MTGFQLIALLLTLTAVFSYINHRTLKLPTTIGVMLISLLVSLFLVALGRMGFGVETFAATLLEGIKPGELLLQGMLGFLLFAGALHVDLGDILENKLPIGVLATVGVALSALWVGAGMYLLSRLLGLEVPFVFCLLFGTLISPTDPIAVLGILRKAGVPKGVEIKITGESLFNDGVGVVLFLAVAAVAVKGQSPTFGWVAKVLLVEVGGGALLGLVLGWIAYRMLKSIEDYHVEMLITLALVTGGYALASALHASGPICAVISGLLIGNHGRRFAMTEPTREHLDSFWEFVDEILNAVLFVLIGLEVMLLTFRASYLLAGLLAIPLVLSGRLLSVGGLVTAMRRWVDFTPGVVRVMTWGGLRGGISVALALSLPPGPERDVLLTATYCVVAFSILAQGLTIKKVVSKEL